MLKNFLGKRAWMLPVGWALLIFIMSSIPDLTPTTFELFEHADKLVHMCVYIPLGFGLMHAFSEFPVLWKKPTAMHAYCLGVFYGLTDEVHQLFVAGRYFDLADWLADGFGVFFGIFAYLVLRTTYPQREWR